MVGLNIPKDQVSSIVKKTMKEADEDKDNFISLEEFKKVLIIKLMSMIFLVNSIAFFRHLWISKFQINWVSVSQEPKFQLFNLLLCFVIKFYALY